ncbi:MAG: HAD-IA family hydrolase [Actinomycetota bacterium]|nr:HAD-IA family hydrolase [Actinomycetota bacterium]
MDDQGRTRRSAGLIPVFDLDGTLLDSDAALVEPFLALGVQSEEITFGHTLEEECCRLGIDLDAYLDRYDDAAAGPFPGVAELVGTLDRWAVCSNKHPRPGRAELARLGWTPEVALFADAFGGPKRLGPVLDALGATGEQVLFVGDTSHDRRCAAVVGCPFVLAGWNSRAAAAPGDLVAAYPADVSGYLGRPGAVASS